MQITTHPHVYGEWGLPAARRHHRDDYVAALTTAVHQVAVEGLAPEQAVNEAIAHIKQVLSE